MSIKTTIQTVLVFACVMYSIYSLAWLMRSHTAGHDFVALVQQDYVQLESASRHALRLVQDGLDSLVECKRNGIRTCINNQVVKDGYDVIMNMVQSKMRDVCSRIG